MRATNSDSGCWASAPPLLRLVRQGETWGSNLCLAPSPSGNGLIVAWLERDHKSLIKVAWFNPKIPKSTLVREIKCPSNVSAIAMTPLPDGRACIAAAHARTVSVGFADRDQDSNFELRSVGIGNGVSHLDVFTADSNALFVSWSEAAAVHKIADARTYLIFTNNKPFAVGAGRLTTSTMLRVIVGASEPHLTPPQYKLHGTILRNGTSIAQQFFHYLPSQIVGDTYGYPAEFVIHPLGDHAFLLAWVLLPNHVSNIVQYQCFSHDGTPQGDVVTVSSSDATSSVTSLSLAPLGTKDVVIAWVRIRNETSCYESAICEIDTQMVSAQRPSTSIDTMGRLAMAGDNKSAYAVYLQPGEIVVAEML
jgi:hypothetical protein